MTTYADAQKAMTGLKPRSLQAQPRRPRGLSGKLYSLRSLQQLHDAFGTEQWTGNLHGVMKRLIQIRDRARK